MQTGLKEQWNKSTISKEDHSARFDIEIPSDDQKNHFSIYYDSQKTFNDPTPINIRSQHGFNKIEVITSNLQHSKKYQPTILANKKQFIESIKFSYQVLSNSISVYPDKKKNQIVKKSFVVISQDQDKNIPSDKIIQSLKTPLKIDLRKLQTNIKFTELSEGLQFLNGKHWEDCQMDIDMKAQELIVSNLHIQFSTISKIKIYKPNEQKKQREIKITYEKVRQQGVLNLNIRRQKHLKKVPTDYVIFQEILVNKLAFQKKLKEKKWQKKAHICEQIIFESYIFGQIYKKSQFLGNWQRRYIVLNGRGIFSYKSLAKKEEHTFQIDRECIEYMWSRFDMIDGHLIIKIKHGLKQTEFGIPIATYCYPHYKNWLYYFYKLMTNN